MSGFNPDDCIGDRAEAIARLHAARREAQRAHVGAALTEFFAAVRIFEARRAAWNEALDLAEREAWISTWDGWYVTEPRIEWGRVRAAAKERS